MYHGQLLISHWYTGYSCIGGDLFPGLPVYSKEFFFSIFKIFWICTAKIQQKSVLFKGNRLIRLQLNPYVYALE